MFALIDKKQSSWTEILNASLYINFDWQHLKIQNGLFHTYCINAYGITHQHERVKYSPYHLRPRVS